MFYERTADELKKLTKKQLKYQLLIVQDEIEATKERKKESVVSNEPVDYAERNKTLQGWIRRMRKYQKNIREVL
jgi:hypothetical protein